MGKNSQQSERPLASPIQGNKACGQRKVFLVKREVQSEDATGGEG